MGVVMRVGAQLDERAAQRVADKAERTFNDAGARAGRGFGRSFEQQVETALTEKSLEKSARKIEAMMTRTGKTSAEALNQAIANEAERTGLGADKIGQHLQARLGVHGGSAGRQFVDTFMGELGRVSPGVSSAMSSISRVGSTAMEAIGGSAIAATASVVAVGAAAVVAGEKLYEIGSKFDRVAVSVERQTGKMGADLKGLTDSIDHVSTHTASSLETIGGIAASVSQAFHTSGQPLENLTQQIANLDRQTGTPTNVRDLGKVMRAFGMDANQAGSGLDELKVASEHTGAPIGELLENLKAVGASARSLHLDFGQTAAMIDMFDEAGIDASTTTRGLNKAIGEATKQHIDLHDVLQRSIEDIGKFLAAGQEDKAQEMAQKLFGTKGAQQFVDAIRQGKLNVEDLDAALKKTRDDGHINKLNEDTMRFADTWQIVKNRIEDALKPLADPVFQGIQEIMRDVVGYRDPNLGNTGYHDPDAKPGDPKSLFPGLPGAPAPAAPGGMPPGWKMGPGGIPMPLPAGAPGVPAGVPGAAPPSGDQGDLQDQLDDSGTPKPVHLPYGPGYGAPPAPGESEQHWRLQQDLIEKQHDLAEKRATLDEAEKSHLVKQDELIKLRSDVTKAQSEADTAGRAVTNYRPKVEVPYAPGYGAAPRPGEPEKMYSAEQGMYEAQHKRAEAQATLNQLESQAGATDADKIKARNDLAAAEHAEYEAQMKLREAALNTSKDLGTLGAAIDNDFGISKGIPGIVENLVKTLADVAAAPMLGKLAAYSNIDDAQTGLEGGSGLIGIMGRQNLLEGKSPLFGQPLQGPGAEAGYDSIGGGGGLLGNLLGFGGPGNTRRSGQPGYVPGGTPNLNFTANPTADVGGASGNGLNLSTIAVAAQQYANDCIDASAQIILSHSGVNLTQDQLGEVIPRGGTISSQAAGMNKLDPAGKFVPMEGSGGSPQAMFAAIKASIDQGVGSILNVAPGSSLAGRNYADGHFIAATGYNPDGTINLSDTARGTKYSVTQADAFQATRGRGIVAGTGQGPGAQAGLAVAGDIPGAPGNASAGVPGPLGDSGGGVVSVYVTNMPGGGLGTDPNAPGGPGPGGAPGAGGAPGGPGPVGGNPAFPGDPTQDDDNRPGGGGWLKDPSNKGKPGFPGGPPPPAPPAPPPPPPPPAPAAPRAAAPPAAAPGAIVPGAGGLFPGIPGASQFHPTGYGQPGGGGHLADWDKIAGPEAGGNWQNSSNPKYKGGLQFDQGTWDRHGGQQYAPRADLASPEDQKTVADRTLAAQGPGAWPATSAAHPEWFHPPGGQGPANDTIVGPGGGPAVQSAGFGTAGDPGPPGGGPKPPSAIGGPGGAPGARADQGPGGGPTKLGGVAGPANPSGGQAGITPGGTLDSALSAAAGAFPGGGAAAQLAIKETNRAIQYGSQVAGIAAQGLMSTFLPTGGSELAQNSWLTKIFSGLAGARPETPNLAGSPAAKPVKPSGQGGPDDGKGGNGDTTNNVTINQASAQPANDITHALTVQAQSAPALGR